jgi:hypothetical protein
MGLYSTPWLLEHCDELVSLEQDPEVVLAVKGPVGTWGNDAETRRRGDAGTEEPSADRAQSGERRGECRHEVWVGFDWVRPTTRYEDLSPDQLLRLRNWMRGRVGTRRFDLLFIDGCHVERQMALELFAAQAQVIVVHDWCYNGYLRPGWRPAGEWLWYRDRLLYPETCCLVRPSIADWDRLPERLNRERIIWLANLSEAEVRCEPMRRQESGDRGQE